MDPLTEAASLTNEEDEWKSINNSDEEGGGSFQITEMFWLRESIYAVFVLQGLPDADDEDENLHIVAVGGRDQSLHFLPDCVTMMPLASDPLTTKVHLLLVMRSKELLIIDCTNSSNFEKVIILSTTSELTGFSLYVDEIRRKIMIAICEDSRKFRLLEYSSPF